mmetsp:Transcript_15105/g.54410  ORF Transcript_15105/g.54410 Transcript_15105/m.54410 type:complete len:366 (+) Transcript_15105:669-1766(+)
MDLTRRRSLTYTGGSHESWRYARRSTMRSTTPRGTSTRASASALTPSKSATLRDSHAGSSFEPPTFASHANSAARMESNPDRDPALTCSTLDRNRKRSYSASSSSLSGSSFDAPTRHSSGTLTRSAPLSNSRSLRMVSSEFKMAELALKTSSTNATVAVGRYPSVCRTYRSFSSPRMDSGPKSSSGTLNRVSSRSKNAPPSQMEDRRRPSSDLAVPGGPSSSRCSPQKAARRSSRTSVSRSTSPDSRTDVASRIFFARSDAGRPAPFAASPGSPPAPTSRIGARSSSTRRLTASSSTLISASCSRCFVFQSGSAAARHRAFLAARPPRWRVVDARGVARGAAAVGIATDVMTSFPASPPSSSGCR